MAHFLRSLHLSLLVIHKQTQPLYIKPKVNFEKNHFNLNNNVMRKKILSSFFLVCSFLLTQAQSYVSDNYSGVNGIFINPARTLNPKLKADVNIFTLDVLAESNTLTWGGDFLPEKGKDDYFNRLSLYLQGPSLMFKIDNKNAVALSTSLSFSSIANGNNSIVKLIENKDDVQLSDLSAPSSGEFSLLPRIEISGSYARLLIDKEKHALTGGVSLRLIQNIGYASSLFNDIQATEMSDDQFLVNGNLSILSPSYMISDNGEIMTDLDNFEYSPKLSLAFDFGVSYEWKPEKNEGYKLKGELAWINAGASKMPLKEHTAINYVVDNKLISVEEWEQSNDVYDDFFTAVDTTSQTMKLDLEQRLNLAVDYHIAKHFYVNAFSSILLTDGPQKELYRGTSFTITPRYERRMFAVMLPLEHSPEGDLNVGLGLRLGPLFLGASNLAYGSDKFVNSRVYLGVKIPFAHKAKKEKS